MVRKIVHIDEEKCNGCGACANACHESAIAMINGKARLIRDDYCDGLGDCLPACPTDAIRIIEREAAEYDEEAVKERIQKQKEEEANSWSHSGENKKGHVCPGSMARMFSPKVTQTDAPTAARQEKQESVSMLRQWPVQIKLLPTKAPYFENANLLIAADCSAYAYAEFHRDFIKNHITLIGCPKLDEIDYAEKLTQIIKNNNIKSVKVVRMEVPCCGGLTQAVIRALQNSGKMIPWQVVTISCEGRVIED